MEFLKSVGREIYERVVVSNKSTFIGWGLAAAIIVVNQGALLIAGWSSPYAGVAAMVVGAIGTFLKNKAKVEAAKAALPPAP